ncbi:MAG: alanine--tRNA ligase [Gemmatimonadetes bacterium]|nr:alanine--tRNA ligase [Gemmatimonadota bacterium]
MKSSAIRQRFVDYFVARGHAERPSSPLVPANDPTLLFTNAGMVQFKEVFLGLEVPRYRRAATAQKCVRAGGKHNDLEEVGRTARHHTFFEMLGNFSFGDYFKAEAIEYAWGFLTDEMGLDRDRMYVTVHRSDDEAAELWGEVAGVPRSRVFRMGDRENFWQMADTGPCGPCSEIHYDLRPAAEASAEISQSDFERLSEIGELLELWNLVFMQFDRGADGIQAPLPAPSIDTGLGLERLASVMQGADSNYHTDLFLPLIDRVAEVVGRGYEPGSRKGVSYRVLADHARACAFLLADGVYPANEGRGYVLRRILRRAVRHAWLLGRRDPTLAKVAGAAIDEMGAAYPELESARDAIVSSVLAEERRFLATVDGGMERLARLAPPRRRDGDRWPAIPGAEAFKLYDTFGFPLDLTRLVAEERGYGVDEEGFAAAMEEQRRRSRAAAIEGKGGEVPSAAGIAPDRDGELEDAGLVSAFVGYDVLTTRTEVLHARGDRDGGAELVLRERPFYAEAGGQVADRGTVRELEGRWALEVERTVERGGVYLVRGAVSGDYDSRRARGSAVEAAVDPRRRRDVERSHTATHLLHAALRSVLGAHVRQRGSLVAPARLRFDFAHTAPLEADELGEVGRLVSEGAWASHPVTATLKPYAEAVADGAIALFGEKYGEEVRVVEIPGVSAELCGGTHVRHTGEIGPFVIVSETGVAAGVRRIEALTGRAATSHLGGYRRRVKGLAELLKCSPEGVERRVAELHAANAELEELVDALQQGGGGGEILAEASFEAAGRTLQYRGVRLQLRGASDAREWGDRYRRVPGAGVAVVAAQMTGGKCALFAFASDVAVAAGLRADSVVREFASKVGGRGGGRAHSAQAGVGDPRGLDEVVRSGAKILTNLVKG